MKFLNPTVTVDVVIFTVEEGVLKTLIITRAKAPYEGLPALPGGFIHEGETSVTAAERILRDKAGVKGVYLEQLYTFDAPTRDPRGPVFSVTYFALVPPGEAKISETIDTQMPRFVPVSSISKLAFDHSKIVSYAVERLKSKAEYTNVVYSLLPKSFTLTELQKMYEITLGRDLDKRNFRKKMAELDLLEETGASSKGGRQRPAKLYRFKSRKPQELKKFF
ncbi:MAG TPA: NUDIX domain-containing protein [Candidatus Paceibacterota bacterium]|nr:NUDIX domain-containing protein [Candidatus Paceibacterota bacterium]